LTVIKARCIESQIAAGNGMNAIRAASARMKCCSDPAGKSYAVAANIATGAAKIIRKKNVSG